MQAVPVINDSELALESLLVLDGQVETGAVTQNEDVRAQLLVRAEFRIFVPAAARRYDLFTRQAERLRRTHVLPHMVGQDVRERLRVVDALDTRCDSP